jgi:anaerobic ribonucleoside-triphosphate reductase activating protein
VRELLNIHSVIDNSRVNGPGLRLVVFTQGCAHGCKGCFNGALHPYDCGEKISPEELLSSHYSKETVGITVSGGEPFDQPDALYRLLKTAREKYNLSSVVYSGYTHKELLSRESAKECLSFVDVLIDGRFEEGKLEKTLLARGSTNQKIIILTDKYKLEDFYMPGKVEITIGPDGSITSTGFSDPGTKFKDAV